MFYLLRQDEEGQGLVEYALILVLVALVGTCIFLLLAAPLIFSRPVSADVGACEMFPFNSVFNTPIDTLPVDANSDAYINSIGADTGLHPDFGAGLWNGAPIGIPYNIVPRKQPLLPVKFLYADESDAGPYPIPTNPKIEGGSDRHMLMV